MNIPKQAAAVYLVKPEFFSELSQEIGSVTHTVEDLIFSSEKKTDLCFAKDIWLNPQIVSFQSISEAVGILKKIQKFWYLHPLSHIRRSRLIEAGLRKYPPLQQFFPIETPPPPIGGFSLLDKNTLLYSANRQSHWPDGIVCFAEDKINPPNRAYLKLWEALTLLQKYPTSGDTVLDLGASPGGWTWVMQSLGAEVTAVDKAPLHPNIMSLPRVTFLQQSAFALDPDKLEHPCDWVLSDIACYPDRALTLIKKWINSGKARQMIFTIKLQGAVDLATIRQFQALPDSRLINLHHNKHEATFFYPFRNV